MANNTDRRAPLALVLGCAGVRLDEAERAFFREARPCGFILFKRNCESPDQVRALVSDMREAVDDPKAPVLIDQEGGRVVRLGPPHWRKPPAGAVFAALVQRDVASAERAVYLNARLMAAELAALGISVDCYPVLDLRRPGASEVVGDRALGSCPADVTRLGRAACNGLLDGGILPVIKHMPGHGRARVDSHHTLPVVDATRAQLEASDFQPFRALADMPIAITAHVRYEAIDTERPATISPIVIREVMRGFIGFDGLLLTDDLSMAALEGSIAARAAASLEAGCDVALHCNGRLEEMEQVAAAVPPLAGEAARRYAAALARLSAPAPFDVADGRSHLAGLIGAAAA
ncbi:MAG: beta-N-acetylhexosaminidase [Alphaproteobacteria bacterium]